MGTRALRKLREQEWDKQLAATHNEGDVESEEDEPVFVAKPRNAFDMLNEVEVEDEEDDEVDENEPSQPTHPQPSPPQSSTPKSNKRKKKKSKKKQKDKSDTPQTQESRNVSEDEIDKALKELALKQRLGHHGESAERKVMWEQDATKHLAIEPRNLDPVNEMRGLFGNIALEDEPRTRSQPTRRREQNLQGGVDLQTALTGRYNRASQGKELGALAKRRNCFIQGKEEWPLAASGGLSMEALPVAGFEKQYNVIHNQIYKAAQWDFRLARESMQAEAMIAMLQKYPYHVSSLLQVSEIAKSQGDSSLAGDLVERALFTLGRSVHSSFPTAVREGVARLDFNKPANRELYLSIWRYIRNLEQRGTWKTAFEWSKLLLQFNTTSDPFGITLMIDQLALRGRQHEQFLSLVSDSAYGNTWAHLPNICISKTLALLRAQKPREARQQLALAMQRYPYILSALASALEVSPIPKAIWGKLASSDAEKLYSELYVTRAKDLWNTPETIGLISEVANTLQYYKSFIDQQPLVPRLQISLEEARHVLGLEIPSLIAFLPRKFTTMPTSSTDVLPPPESESSNLTSRAPTDAPTAGSDGHNPGIVAVGNDLFRRALRWFTDPTNRPENEDEPSGDQNNGDWAQPGLLAALREELGPQAAEIPDDVLHQMLQYQVATEMLEEDDLRAAFPGGPMAGGWDYYEDAALNGEDGATDSDDLPELENIGGTAGAAAAGEITGEDEAGPQRRLHAATVEEGEDEDEAPRQQVRPELGPVLRRIDSDEERESTLFSPPVRQAPQAEAVPAPAPNPVAAPLPSPSLSDQEIESHPERLQRWLITAGLEDIKASTNTSTYIRRLKLLNKNQQGWILNVVRQRGNTDVAARIEGML